MMKTRAGSRLSVLLFTAFLAVSSSVSAQESRSIFSRIFGDKSTAPPKSPEEPYRALPGGVPAEARAIDRQAAAAVAASRQWSLPALVDEALRLNPATRSSWYQARASAANVDKAAGLLLPSVTGTATGSKSYTKTPTFPHFSNERELSGALGLTIQWTLLDFAAFPGIEAARFQLLVSDYTINTTMQQVVLNVLTSYYNLDGAKAQVANAEASLAVALASKQYAIMRRQSGLGTITDQLQAEQKAAQAQYNLENARGTLRTAEVNLAGAIGLPGNIRLTVLPPKSPPSVDWLNREVDLLVEKALSERPDLAVKYNNWRAQLATAKAAEAQMWPTITLNSSLQRTYFDATMGRADTTTLFEDGNSIQNSVGITVSWDIFDGWQNWNAAKAARFQADAARADLESAELSAITDVVSNYVDVKNAAANLQAAQVLVDSSKKSYDSTLISYRSGLTNVINLLTSQSDLASANASLIQARTQLYIASANLANSIGGLLPPRPIPVPTKKAKP